MIIDMSERVVVVTGSSKGIGAELIKAFARVNAKVVINYLHSEKEAKKLQDEIAAYSQHYKMIKADITKQEEVSELFHETLRHFGRIDVLVNNAGICDDNLIQMMPEEQWCRVIDVNLKGTYLCSRAFSKAMIKQKSGKIINIASLKGQVGSEGQVNYSASKAGIIGFTKSLAKELGKHNVAVNAICPGFIVTDLNRHNTEKLRRAMEHSLLDCSFALDDLLNFVLLLASDQIRGVSSQVFNLDSRILI